MGCLYMVYSDGRQRERERERERVRESKREREKEREREREVRDIWQNNFIRAKDGRSQSANNST